MTTNANGNTFISNEYLTTYGTMAFLYYNNSKLSVIAKNYFGQNLSYLTIIGGYAISSRDVDNGVETYTPYISNSSLLNIVYGKKWQAGLTLGLSNNFGTKDRVLQDGNFKEITGGLLPEIKDLYRVAPHLALNISNMKFLLEYEMTSAKYGIGELDYSNGLYKDSHWATNNRFALTMMYIFN